MAADPFLPIDDTYIAGSDSYGEYNPGEPQERIEEEAKAKAVITSSYPIMAEVADWFHEQAQDAMDIANINLESKVPVAAQVLAFQLYQTKMIEKAQEFEQYRSEKYE